MVVTCYSRTCNRPELPIFSASWKRVRAYVCASVRTHTIATTRSTSEQPRNRRENIWVWTDCAECERICRLLWCLRSPPSNNDDENDDENDDDEGEEKEEKHDDDEERLAAFRLYLFFSSQSFLSSTSPVSLCTLLSYSFISFLLR